MKMGSKIASYHSKRLSSPRYAIVFSTNLCQFCKRRHQIGADWYMMQLRARPESTSVSRHARRDRELGEKAGDVLIRVGVEFQT